MDVKAYLARIGINEIPEPNFENLKLIQSRHLLNVPFENLNIHMYNKLSADPVELFEKIVLQRRGGICYELNYLYMLMLNELGYKTSFHGARVSDNGTFYDHSFPMVEINGYTISYRCRFRRQFSLPVGVQP